MDPDNYQKLFALCCKVFKQWAIKDPKKDGLNAKGIYFLTYQKWESSQSQS